MYLIDPSVFAAIVSVVRSVQCLRFRVVFRSVKLIAVQLRSVKLVAVKLRSVNFHRLPSLSPLLLRYHGLYAFRGR